MTLGHSSRPVATSHEYVVQELRSRIFRGDLRPGDRLLQTGISRDLGVSNTPVREALRSLAAEGLIELDPHRGGVVRRLDEQAAREIYLLRSTLEPLAVDLAMQRVQSIDFTKAEELIAAMDAERDPATWVDLNRSFHALFADAAGSPRLSEILGHLRDSAAGYVGRALTRDPGLMRRGNEDHRQLLAAFTKGDAEAAKQVELRHLEATLTALLLEEDAMLPQGGDQPAELWRGAGRPAENG